MEEKKQNVNNTYAIKKLYQVILITGLTPFILLIVSFLIWGLADDKLPVNDLVQLVIVLTFGLLCINSFFLYLYYGKAKRQNNTRALARIVPLIGLLLFTIVMVLISYNYIQYAKTSHTIVIKNHSPLLVNKIFLSQGAEKYFISPVEPHDTLKRVLQFKSSSQITYTFDSGRKTYNGTLLDDTVTSQGKETVMIIYRNGRAKVN